jgi:cysteine desulfurase
VEPETLYFTSGGTESNAIVLHSRLLKKGKGRALFSAVEHSSIRENCRILEGMGLSASSIPVDAEGRVSPEILSRTLEKYGDVRFAAIMSVNNETGTIMDMAALSGLLRKRDGAPIHLHCDITQAVGKTPVDIKGWDLDSASLSAHKLGGPRGIGLLYLRKPLPVLCAGGGQERGVRPGTENTEGALALAEVLELRAKPGQVAADMEQAGRRWDRLLKALGGIERCFLIPKEREKGTGSFSPYIVQAAFSGVPGEVMVRALDDMGFAVSTGSACSSNSPERPVLKAMGVDPRRILEGIRISQGWPTTSEDIDCLTGAIQETLDFL